MFFSAHFATRPLHFLCPAHLLNWEIETVEKMENELLCIQLESTDTLLKKSYYDVLGAWHQKHFGSMPTYEVYKSTNKCGDGYWCEIRFCVPTQTWKACVRCDIPMACSPSQREILSQSSLEN